MKLKWENKKNSDGSGIKLDCEWFGSELKWIRQGGMYIRCGKKEGFGICICYSMKGLGWNYNYTLCLV